MVWRVCGVVLVGAFFLGSCSSDGGDSPTVAQRDLLSPRSSFCELSKDIRRSMEKRGTTFDDILIEPDSGDKRVVGLHATFVANIPGYLTSSGTPQTLDAYVDFKPFQKYVRTLVLVTYVDFLKHDGIWNKLSRSKRAGTTKDLESSMPEARRQARQIDELVRRGACGK